MQLTAAAGHALAVWAIGSGLTAATGTSDLITQICLSQAGRAPRLRSEKGGTTKGDEVSSDLRAVRTAKTILLTTYRRDGAPVETPVSIAFGSGRAFFR